MFLDSSLRDDHEAMYSTLRATPDNIEEILKKLESQDQDKYEVVSDQVNRVYEAYRLSIEKNNQTSNGSAILVDYSKQAKPSPSTYVESGTTINPEQVNPYSQPVDGRYDPNISKLLLEIRSVEEQDKALPPNDPQTTSTRARLRNEGNELWKQLTSNNKATEIVPGVNVVGDPDQKHVQMIRELINRDQFLKEQLTQAGQKEQISIALVNNETMQSLVSGAL
jgi:hypothetical protein